LERWETEATSINQGSDGFDRLRPVSLAATPEIIADQIRDLIMDGTLRPGTQLTESRLASQLHVSRGPVREAVQRLVQQGILRNERYRGVFVATLTTEDIVDIYEARIAVERAALTKLMTRRIDRSVLVQLQELIDEAARVRGQQPWDVVTSVDLEFHHAIVDASGSKRLARIWESLMVESRMCVAMLQSEYWNYQQRIEHDHRDLLDAIARGELQRASIHLEHHLRGTIRDIVGIAEHNEISLVGGSGAVGDAAYSQRAHKGT
jgi:DNA-binding GntR family transcriptional regulator